MANVCNEDTVGCKFAYFFTHDHAEVWLGCWLKKLKKIVQKKIGVNNFMAWVSYFCSIELLNYKKMSYCFTCPKERLHQFPFLADGTPGCAYGMMWHPSVNL